MSSTNAERSISSNNFLPQWIKTKATNSFDWDQAVVSQTLSENDGFFFIPYPTSESKKLNNIVDSQSQGGKSSNEMSQDNTAVMKRSSTVPDQRNEKSTGNMNSITNTNNSSNNIGYNNTNNNKSFVTNMFSGSIFGNILSGPESNQQQQQRPLVKPIIQEPVGAATESPDRRYRRERRDSKSLPASPLSSPRLFRKNPFFADPFARPDETFQPGKSLLIMSITSQRKSLDDLLSGGGVGGAGCESASNSQYNTPAVSAANSPKIPRRPNKFANGEPRPSELREMNVWSPVSM